MQKRHTLTPYGLKKLQLSFEVKCNSSISQAFKHQGICIDIVQNSFRGRLINAFLVKTVDFIILKTFLYFP